MFFIILLLCICGIAALLVSVRHSGTIKRWSDPAETVAIISGVMGMIGVVFLFVGVLANISHIAGDRGTIAEQHRVIAVEQGRVVRLNIQLKQLVPLAKAGRSLFNKDSPVSTIVKQIAASEVRLARAKTELAEAYVTLSQRKHGVFGWLLKIY